MEPVITRPPTATERPQAAALLGLIDPTTRVQAAFAGAQLIGAAAYRLPDRPGQDAQLGAVSLSVSNRPSPGSGQRWDVFYGLVRATAEDALAAGHTHAMFTVKDRRLLDRIERDFRVEPKPCGWEPSTTNVPGAPVEWLVRVDLADALAQLDRVLARLGAS